MKWLLSVVVIQICSQVCCAQYCTDPVVRDSPAWKAGIGPGMKVLAVNQRSWSRQALRDAIADNGSTAPLVLSLQNGSGKFDATIRERVVARHPHLARRRGPDLMSKMLKPTISRFELD